MWKMYDKLWCSYIYSCLKKHQKDSYKAKLKQLKGWKCFETIYIFDTFHCVGYFKMYVSNYELVCIF